MDRGVIKILSLILGLFFFIISFLITDHLLRLVIITIGIIILIFSSVIEREHKKLAIIFFTIIIFSIAQFTDYLTIKYFNKSPLLAYNILEFDNVRVYDSIFYRVWQCNTEKKEYIIDDLEKIGYFCDLNYIESTNINNFAVELINNFSRYYNTYIKLNGIVYDIDDNFITLKSYIYKDEKIIFNDNITVKVYMNSSFNNISKNEEIELSGKIVKNEGKIIYIEDGVLS